MTELAVSIKPENQSLSPNGVEHGPYPQSEPGYGEYEQLLGHMRAIDGARNIGRITHDTAWVLRENLELWARLAIRIREQAIAAINTEY